MAQTLYQTARVALQGQSRGVDAVALRGGDSSAALIFSGQAGQCLQDSPSNAVKIVTHTRE